MCVIFATFLISDFEENCHLHVFILLAQRIFSKLKMHVKEMILIDNNDIT